MKSEAQINGKIRQLEGQKEEANDGRFIGMICQDITLLKWVLEE